MGRGDVEEEVWPGQQQRHGVNWFNVAAPQPERRGGGKGRQRSGGATKCSEAMYSRCRWA